MNLASINSYNTSFSANYKKGGKYSRPTAYSRGGAHAANTYKKSHKTALKTGVAATILTAGTLAAIFIPKGNDNKGAMAETTQPTYSYTETYNQEETTQPTIESQITYNRPINNSTMSVTTTPIEQREPKWHTVVTGDRLADIVKEYAKIDSSTPDHELSPYYVILLRDNSNLVASNKIENFDNMSDAEVISKLNNGEISVNNIHRGASYRVDGILPEYRKDAYIGNATQTEEQSQQKFKEKHLLKIQLKLMALHTYLTKEQCIKIAKTNTLEKCMAIMQKLKENCSQEKLQQQFTQAQALIAKLQQ